MDNGVEVYIKNYVFSLIEARSSFKYQESVVENLNYRAQLA
jgi:hypothetical protein